MRAPSLPDLVVSHWQLTPYPTVLLALSAGLYLWGTRRVRGRWPIARTVSFLAGLGAVLVALASGLDAYDDQMLTAHMVQHLILLLVAPLLLLGGRPAVLALRALPRSGRGQVGRAMRHLRFLGHWTVGLAAFYAAVLVPHLAVIYDAALRHPLVHEAEHLAFLAGGLLFLWPLVGAPVGRAALGGVASLCYVIASMPSCAIVGAYLNRATSVVYAPYGPAGRALGISPVINQQQAGAIMWVGAHVILTAVALWVLGTKLVAEERRQRVRDALEDRTAIGGPGREGAALS